MPLTQRTWSWRRAGPPPAPCAPGSPPISKPAEGAPPHIRFGLDTGGTYTDAIALDAEQRVLASAKARTTHWDLAIGIREACGALLAALPPHVQRADVGLVAVSTTLATNAVVEGRFSPICTLLVGFDERMVERSALRRGGGGSVVCVRGGHDAAGDEAEALDEAAVQAAVAQWGATVEAFAVAAMFSVRNPAHELRARALIRAGCNKPVTCSHELSAQLDAPRRALTAALNARLTPQIRHLLDSVQAVLTHEGIAAPLMIVRGDGSLVKAEVALEYPVETVLSGPAASVVGASFLCGLKDFVVSDMGGTTTDVAVVAEGRPVVRPEGAVIGGWRTMVQAIDVHTCGLGGDSEVSFDRERRLTVGPRRVVPLSLFAHEFPAVREELERLAGASSLPAFAGQFARRNPGSAPGAPLDRLEQRVYEALGPEPRRLDTVARTAPGVEALRRLVDRGLATLAGFTPSDALHVLGQQHGWCVEAARLGAALLALEERNASARREADTAEGICRRTREHVLRQSARAVLDTALARDPGLEGVRPGPFLQLLDEVAAGRAFSRLLALNVQLASPLVAIGAPAAAYYGEVAQRLGARLYVPEHAQVCNAVGAAAGMVSEVLELTVNQPVLNVFRVHDPAGSRDFDDPKAALEEAQRLARERVLAAALRSGARDPHVEISVSERRARTNTGDEYLAEATVTARATGIPVVNRSAPAADTPKTAPP
ncbi:MAG: hydantoinase/oxoprolinase family protein [Gammaproteobacteria bacterium]|nr:hydantoinase/oxoprolinase family protein [Gammaproteobacteria bacterium]